MITSDAAPQMCNIGQSRYVMEDFQLGRIANTNVGSSPSRRFRPMKFTVSAWKSTHENKSSKAFLSPLIPNLVEVMGTVEGYDWQ